MDVERFGQSLERTPGLLDRLFTELPRSRARHLIDQGLWLSGKAGDVLAEVAWKPDPETTGYLRFHDWRGKMELSHKVLDRLLENGWIKQADADKARKDPLTVTNRTNGAHIFAGEYFAEEVRRDIFERHNQIRLSVRDTRFFLQSVRQFPRFPNR